MKEKIKQVIELYEKGLSLSEIHEITGLSISEFNKILKAIKDTGYNTSKSYHSDGKIIVKRNKTLDFKTSNSIRVNVKDRILRAIFISDPHIGSEFDRPDLLKQVVDYAKTHDIHIIFNGGDMIENVYPYNPDITYFNLYGNHDYKSILEQGFDVGRYIEERRFDMVSLGYGKCIMNLKDDMIVLVHDLKKSNKNTIPNNASLVFRGHSHKSKNRENKIIYIPSLSDGDISCYEFKPLIGFLDVEFIFFEKKIAKVNIKQLAFVNDEIRLANEETMILKEGYVEKKKEYDSNKKLTKKPHHQQKQPEITQKN